MIDFVPRLNPSVLAYPKKDGLLQEGHYVFPSGRHSAVRLNRDRLLANPTRRESHGYAVAKAFFIEKVDVVASPSIWGGGLAQWVAYFLQPRASVVYATPGTAGDLHIATNLTGLQSDRPDRWQTRVARRQHHAERSHNGDILSGRASGRRRGHWCRHVVGWRPAHGGRSVHGLLNDPYSAYLPAECPLCARGKGNNSHALQHVTS